MLPHANAVSNDRDCRLPCLLLQVEEAGERVEQELTAALATAEDYAHSSDMRSLRPSLVYDPVNNAVWIKLPKGSQVRCSPAHCWVHPMSTAVASTAC